MIGLEKKLVALVCIALLAGLGGGYGLGFTIYQPQISALQSDVSMLKASENKTWHFVMNFTTNETNKISPQFYIQGEKWRIKWNLITVERVVELKLNGLENITSLQIEWDVRRTGFIVFDDSENVVSFIDIDLEFLIKEKQKRTHEWTHGWKERVYNGSRILN